MLTGHAGGLTGVQVRARLGGAAPGYLFLFQKKNNEWVRLARNPSTAEELVHSVPPEIDLVELSIAVGNEDKGGQDQPIYLELSQNGVVIPIHDGDGPVNGSGPYQILRLSPDAPLNKWKNYYFNVRFA